MVKLLKGRVRVRGLVGRGRGLYKRTFMVNVILKENIFQELSIMQN